MKTEIPMSQEEQRIYWLEKITEKLQENGGWAKTGDLLSLGVDFRRLGAYVEDGSLCHLKSGYYCLPLSTPEQEANLVSGLFSDGVLTMQSALFAHGYIDELPVGWAVAISKNVSKSRFLLENPEVEPYYVEPEVLSFGVEEKEVLGSRFQVYTKDRLVCEVLKYQDRLDRDVFKRACFAYIQDDTKDAALLMDYAKKRKVVKKVETMIGVWL